MRCHKTSLMILYLGGFMLHLKDFKIVNSDIEVHVGSIELLAVREIFEILSNQFSQAPLQPSFCSSHDHIYVSFFWSSNIYVSLHVSIMKAMPSCLLARPASIFFPHPYAISPSLTTPHHTPNDQDINSRHRNQKNYHAPVSTQVFDYTIQHNRGK